MDHSTFEDLEVLLRNSLLCRSMYGPRNDFKKYTKDSGYSVVNEYSNTCGTYAVLLFHRHIRTMHLLFQGSTRLLDYIVSCFCCPVPPTTCGYTHALMCGSVFSDIERDIGRFALAHSASLLYVTGHSKGGSLARAFADIGSVRNPHAPFATIVVTFGAPKSVSYPRVSSSPIYDEEKSMTFALEGDVVHDIPFFCVDHGPSRIIRSPGVLGSAASNCLLLHDMDVYVTTITSLMVKTLIPTRHPHQ